MRCDGWITGLLVWIIVPLNGCHGANEARSASARPLGAALAEEDGGTGLALFQRLQMLPGVSDLVESPASGEGASAFTFTIAQAIDHQHPELGSFRLRVQLLHRDEAAPTVLSSTGYYLFSSEPHDSEPSYLLRANSLTVEHRFFGPSTPFRRDDEPEPAASAWAYLTIAQAAADNHHVIEVLKQIYRGPWITTGASKGGMTSIYHRRFYPGDVQGTVAYVAPQSYGTDDPRYVEFLEQVGDAACRERIVAFQRDVLTRRAELMPLFEAQAAAAGLTFEAIGKPKAFEHIAQEFRFAFWQYGYAGDCAALPAVGAATQDVYNALTAVVPVDLAADQGIRSVDAFESYYYQSATELGSYGPLQQHIEDLLQFPGTYSVDVYAPPVEGRSFEPQVMVDIQDWVSQEADQLIFVYGANDPWSAGAFRTSGERDVNTFVVPGGNHGASLTSMGADVSKAFERLQAWSGVMPQPPTDGLRVEERRATPWFHLPPGHLRL